VSDSYDRISYKSLPLAQTHPDRLATIATLFGMTVAPPADCRVLELGCGDGGNLIPMALGLSGSSFTGIDLAARAVEQGRGVVNALGLKNITLLALDLMEAGPELGEFDYIIAHGVYSWVPENVRERVLYVCRANLGPRGVAYVSYNAYPGFHRREMFREMMMFNVEGVEEPVERVRRAIEFIKWLIRCRPESELARALLAEELRHLTESDWWYVYHDDLEQTNHADYFHEFVALARDHGLEYLGEADFLEMQSDIYAASTVETLQRFAQGDVVRKEQYLDFIKGRRFRQTLLCRRETGLHRSPRPEQLMAMYFASPASPISAAPEFQAGVWEEFRGPRGAAMRTGDRQVKRALMWLHGVWPQSMQFADLLTEAEGDAGPLAEALLQAYSAGLLEVNVRPSQFKAEAGDRPVASPLARLQAEDGSMVTTLRHTTEELADDVDRCLVMLLDGSLGRSALLGALRALLRWRAIPGVEPLTEESLETRLARLAKQALLVA
jgi:SAM-dependent methyltransferase